MALISALFIDFDNVHSMLCDDDPNVGARFANRPLHWLKALESDPELIEGTDGVARRIVSRRCYASPGRITPYRRNFTQTGFEVVDCPPLTTHMKNSADITMVMDVMDYVARYPAIEEYIILSADADFVPVLNRLRKEMKRTAIFTAANTSAAYRNCADRTIDFPFFALHLGGGLESGPARASSPEPGERRPRPVSAALAGTVRGLVTELVRAAPGGRVPLATAAHMLRGKIGAQLGNDWAGQRSFTALLHAIELPGIDVNPTTQLISGPQPSGEDLPSAGAMPDPGLEAPAIIDAAPQLLGGWDDA